MYSIQNVFPHNKIVGVYKYFSARPWQWRIFYHLTNTKLNEIFANIHCRMTCSRTIKKTIEFNNPDVIVSVHPTMNNNPLIQTRKISKELRKHIPFFTVVTDLGSGHCMWFERKVDKLYVASDRLYKLAKRRGGTRDDKIAMIGLPIRHGFAVEAEKLGDRTSQAGKSYQRKVREELGINPDKPMVLVVGGGEGVGSLSDIVNQLYAKLTLQGVDATVCVVCGRNEKLKAELAFRDWGAVLSQEDAKRKKRWLRRFLTRLRRFLTRFVTRRRRRKIEEYVNKRLEDMQANQEPRSLGSVDVVGLGFITNMPSYMVAAEVLVTKAGPGTIAEAASVGLPLMLTSFLPGQESGNVDVVLEGGYGDFCREPSEIAQAVGFWLQDEDALSRMSHAAQIAGHPYAANEIVHDIGTQTVEWMDLNEKKVHV